MNPAFIDELSWEMAEVYGAITDQIMINLARHFPYFTPDKLPRSAFAYQAKMLAQMGKVNSETVEIIRQGLKDADEALQGSLEQAIITGVRAVEPELYEGVKAGILKPPGFLPPIVAPNQMQAFKTYYKQSADGLNLVNTTMLESTKQAYASTVSDIASQVEYAQKALNIGAGEVVTGVSSWNEALRHSINRMKENGITGFIDHAGRQWSAEAYAAMDIRTTMANTARAAIWERNEDFGNDLYRVSYHDGARPLCYPWQNKVISASDTPRTVVDLDGNEIRVYTQSETSYGQAAGLFGINCKHYPTPFIPGVSTIHGEPQNEADNSRTYAESQEQRRLERKLREQKRDLQMAKAQNAPQEVIDEYNDRCRETSADIQSFCDQTGRARHRDREAVYTARSFPAADTYDPAEFISEQKERLDKYFGEQGGEQSKYSFGTMQPNAPLVPNPSPASIQTPQPQAPQPIIKQAEINNELINSLKESGIRARDVLKYEIQPSQQNIISKVSGADKTKGSCSSVALAYTANKNGLDVTDYRGGSSRDFFAKPSNILKLLDIEGIEGASLTGGNDFTTAHRLMKKIQPDKEYYMAVGRHAAIVRKTSSGYEYLEMQSGLRKNTWYALDDRELKQRFGCRKSHTLYGMRYDIHGILFDTDSAKDNNIFAEVMKYINTAANSQKKGVGGGER